MTEFTVLAGCLYSDEGKGSVIEEISSEYDVILRCNGSWSSSHVNSKNATNFHLPTCSDNDKILIVGQAMCVKPDILAQEILDHPNFKHIYIHSDCNVILSNSQVDTSIGTLGSGVRNAIINHLNHTGVSLEEYVKKSDDPKIKVIEPHLITEEQYRELTRGKKILVEGSHGYLIDNIFGYYPYVTSTRTTPGGIMGQTGYCPTLCKHVIFVCGLYSLALGVHPEQVTFEQLKIEYDFPEYILYDYGCGTNTRRSIGPLNIDTVKYVIENYPNCEIVFNFFDLVLKNKIFYYLENQELKSIQKNDREKLHGLLEKILQRKVTIREFKKN